MVRRALDGGLLVNAVAADAVRFAPPLTLSADEAEQAVARLADALR